MYKPLPRTVFTITVRGTKKRKDHDCNIDGQAQCGKRDSKNSGRTDQGKRIYDRKRIHGDMDFRKHAVTGHAKRLWNRTPGTGSLSSESRSLQTNGKACQDRYGVGTRHQCGTSTESD